MLPLAMAPLGKSTKIVKTSVADDKLKHHLEDRGIFAGQEVTPVSGSGGNMIIKVKDGNIALNKELALRIYVE